MAGQDTGASSGAPSLTLYVYAVFDAVTDEIVASLSIEGPTSGEGVLRFAAFECSELFDRPYYLKTGESNRRVGYDV